MFIQSFDQSKLRSPSDPSAGSSTQRWSLEMTSVRKNVSSDDDDDVSNDDIHNNDDDVKKDNEYSEIVKETDLPPSPQTRDRILSMTEEDEDETEHQESHEHEHGDDNDDWFEKDIHSDSADEQFEENIVIVDPEYTDDANQLEGDCLQEGFHSDMIPELLNEAICDTDDNEDLRPRLRSSNSVEETLKKDDHFFKKDS